MIRHGLEPFFLIDNTSKLRDGAGRWRRKSIGRAACFTMKSIASFGVPRSTSPLFHTKVMHKCHGARAFTGSQKRILGGVIIGMVSRMRNDWTSGRCRSRARVGQVDDNVLIWRFFWRHFFIVMESFATNTAKDWFS
jgi:hypothetical protein